MIFGSSDQSRNRKQVGVVEIHQGGPIAIGVGPNLGAEVARKECLDGNQNRGKNTWKSSARRPTKRLSYPSCSDYTGPSVVPRAAPTEPSEVLKSNNLRVTSGKTAQPLSNSSGRLRFDKSSRLPLFSTPHFFRVVYLKG